MEEISCIQKLQIGSSFVKYILIYLSLHDCKFTKRFVCHQTGHSKAVLLSKIEVELLMVSELIYKMSGEVENNVESFGIKYDSYEYSKALLNVIHAIDG